MKVLSKKIQETRSVQQRGAQSRAKEIRKIPERVQKAEEAQKASFERPLSSSFSHNPARESAGSEEEKPSRSLGFIK